MSRTTDAQSDRAVTPTDIAFFIPSFAGGGAERATIELARSMTKRGVSVVLVVPSLDGPLLEEASDSGARIVDLGSGRVRRSSLALRRFIRTEKPRWVIASPNDTVVFAHLARTLAGTSGTKVAGVVHSTWSFVDRRAPARMRLARLPFKWALKRIDRVVCVSHGIRTSLQEEFGALPNAVVVPNPVDFERIAAGPRSRAPHPWFADGSRIVLAVGRLNWVKNFPLLLEAFQLVSDAEPKAKLVILGEGDERASLEEQVQALGIGTVVDLPGYAKNPWAYMARSQVLAVSSDYEGFGLVLIEAIACGTRVVSTDCPVGPAEVLEYGRLGRLVTTGDATGLAKALIAALNDESPAEVLFDELEAKYGSRPVVELFVKSLDSA